MTPEQFHDALTLLPGDLVAEADKKRSRKPKVIPWRTYAAAAACLCAVLLGGWVTRFGAAPGLSKQSAPAEAAIMQASGNSAFDTALPETQAAMEEAAPAAEAGEIRSESAMEDTTAVNGTATTIQSLYPGISLINTIEAVPAATTVCYSSTPEPIVFRTRDALDTYAETSIRFQMDSFLETCINYDDNWFANHDLLLVTVCGIPAGQIPVIRDIRHYENQWKFVIAADRNTTEAERRDWHFLLATEKGLVCEEEAMIATTALSGEDLLYQQTYTPHPAGDVPYVDRPETLLVTSRSQLDGYFTEYAGQYDFETMAAVCAVYDQNWFEHHDLLLVLLEANHPDNQQKIVDITQGSRWDWEILISQSGEYYPEQEQDCCHFLIELEKGIISPANNIIRVFEPQPGI